MGMVDADTTVVNEVSLPNPVVVPPQSQLVDAIQLDVVVQPQPVVQRQHGPTRGSCPYYKINGLPA